MFDPLRRLLRSLRVARAAIAIYVGYKRTQRRARGLDPDRAAALWERRHEETAERLYDLAIALKGLYIKSGQFIGTRADIVPPAYVDWLSRLQDRVPPRPAAEIRATIAAELGRPVSALFAEFDDTAIAAASLAQVHRARLHDGRDVAVKVQYAEVEALVGLDMRNLRTIIRLVAWREPKFDYRAIVDELAREMPRELDFVHEAAMIREVTANLAHDEQVVFPAVVDEILTRRVLVTTYVDGAKVLDAEALREMGVEHAAVAKTLASAYGHQILIDGLFQADPHPGNIIICPDGKVALLDFGLTKRLPDDVRLGFARLVLASSRRDPAAVLDAFQDLGIRTRHDDPESLLTLVRLLFDARPLRGDPTIVRRANAALAHNPIDALPTDLVLIGRVIGLLRGVSASLGIAFTAMDMLLPYAQAAIDEQGDSEPGRQDRDAGEAAGD